jgi:RNA polymerase sigma-70 factor (ECF subfamily)
MDDRNMDQEISITIDSFVEGDAQAFAQIVEEHSPMIYNLALSMLRDPHEAEDVLQETFLKAYSARTNFRGDSSLGTWLYRIATNEALMRLRKNAPPTVSVHKPLRGEDGDTYPRQLRDWCCLPERDFMTAETQAELDAAIQSLSLPLRVTFIMRDIQGLSTRETANILEVSESAVKTRLMRARMQLRDQLSTYFSERL